MAGAVRAGSISARQVIEEHLAAIAQEDRRVGAFQLVRAEAALREADEVDRRSDRTTLPIAGVPVAIKDNVDVAGEPTRNGSTATGPDPRPADHATVSRLRRAGAVVVGKTRVPELCVWGHTDGPLGMTRNPWDLGRVPGGSSGGSGAAVAAGLVPLALGADGMGSIRIPAAACGVVGLKPGPGLVPSQADTEGWFGMSEIGPLASTVTDAALMLSVLSGRDDLAATTEPPLLRVAVSVKPPLAGVLVGRAQRRAALATGELLNERGHEVVQRDPPYSFRSVLAMGARWGRGVALDGAGSDRRSLQRRTRGHIRAGSLLARAGFLAEWRRDSWIGAMTGFFADVDLLITPALARKPPRARDRSRRSWIANLQVDANYAPFAAPWNFARLPAMSVPAGLGPGGLPLAVQLVAPEGGEDLLLSVARHLEEVRPWPRRAPAVASVE